MKKQNLGKGVNLISSVSSFQQNHKAYRRNRKVWPIQSEKINRYVPENNLVETLLGKDFKNNCI